MGTHRDDQAPALRLLELPGVAVALPAGHALSSRDAAHLRRLVDHLRALRPANDRGP